MYSFNITENPQFESNPRYQDIKGQRHIMNDRDIRAVLEGELLHRYTNDKDTLVLEESGFRHGAAL